VETVKKLNLRFPVAYGLAAEEISALFTRKKKSFFSPPIF